MRKKFKCDACGVEDFTPEYWDETQMRKEWIKENPGKNFDADQMSIICDDCYQFGIEIGVISAGVKH